MDFFLYLCEVFKLITNQTHKIMEDKKAMNIHEITSDQLKTLRTYFSVDESIVRFENNCKLSTFIYLFGEEEGNRLWVHFTTKCNRTWKLFRTYLLSEQFNAVVINAHFNDMLYTK